MIPTIYTGNEFKSYPKTPRFNMGCIVTEKIDGTNGLIEITECPTGQECHGMNYTDEASGRTYYVRAGSRKRWIQPGNDNFGFAAWVFENAAWLVMHLGPGRHHGEWWGQGVQRGYLQAEKTFSLFDGPGRYPFAIDVDRLRDNPLEKGEILPTFYSLLEGGRIGVVPMVFQGGLADFLPLLELNDMLKQKFLPCGSLAAPGWQDTEGVVVSLRGSGGNQRFKIVWSK